VPGNLVVDEVKMNNVLSHVDTKLRLPLGVTVIVGPNGAGKTSIIDAISYALFSIHSRDPRRKDPLIRIGAASASIEVSFRVGGKRYVVVKRLARGSSTTALLYEVVDGKRRPIAVSPRAVSSELARLTGITADVARYTVIARQGELDILLTDKSKRIEAIDSLLGLKNIEKAYERMREVITRYKGRLELERSLIDRLRRQIEEYRKIVEEKELVLKRLEELEDEERSLEEKLEELNNRKDVLDKLQEKYLNLTSQLTVLERELEREEKRRASLAAEIERIEKLIESYSDYMQLVDSIDLLREAVDVYKKLREYLDEEKSLKRVLSELSGVEEKVERLRRLQDEHARLLRELNSLRDRVREYSELEGRLKSMKSELAEIEHMLSNYKLIVLRGLRRLRIGIGITGIMSASIDIERLLELLRHNRDETESRLKKVEEKLSERIDELGSIRSRIESIADYLEILTRASGRCPLCRRPLTEEHRQRLIRELREEKRRLTWRMEELRREIESLRGEKQRLQKELQRLTRAVELVSNRLEQMREYSRRAEELRKKIESIQGELITLRLDKRRYDDISMKIERLEAEIEKLKPYQERLQELDYARKRLAEITVRVKELKSRLDEYRAALTKACRGCGHILEDLEDALRKTEELRDVIVKLRTLRDSMEEVDKRIKEYRERIAQIRDELESLGYDRELHEEVKKRIREVEEKLKRLAKEKGQVVERIKAIEDTERRIKDLETELRRREVRAKKLEKIVSDLQRIRSVLHNKGLPRLIRSRLRELVTIYMRDILERFNLGFIDVDLDEEFNVTVKTVEGLKSVNMLSGGERIALALALRLAIARALGSRMGILVLDEPTVYLDEERRRDLVDILKASSRALGVSQILIVTHDRELEDAADTIIEVRRENGVSRVAVASP